ncbi:hypothetical protein H8S37_04670 [Mediterraneibacter sp. NSJ-55]|uniref:Uncharacterized protein n=1 Tax=Mediterraneibacter hominis TaxID=2763054 RepID=A0A923LGC0_9FIRM|nr:hypothetical protein [Mediterraneibacter hominis]MBC5688222.1 hypothetical protein [Mediterraneibacter hominis]
MMGKIMSTIDREIIKPRVDAAYQEGFDMTKEDIKSFYSQGSPKRYKRTKAYENSPDSIPPSGGNGSYHYNIHLNEHSYSTGTPGFPVFQEAQHNGSGILGKADTWFEAEEDIRQALENNFT